MSKSTVRVLKSVSTQISDYLLENEKIIIKKNQALCTNCNQTMTKEFQLTQKVSKSNIDELHLQIWNCQCHSICYEWLDRLVNKYIKLKQFQNNRDEELNEHQQQIQKLQEQIPTNIKHRRIQGEMPPDHDYEAEKQRIPQVSNNKWKNRIQYDLIAETGCLRFTGWTRSKIIDQGIICQWNPELIFQTRHFMYCYQPRRLQAQVFGWSHTNLSIWIDKTLHRMNERYALPQLINGKSILEQYWTWDLIHDTTPDWCYRLRECDKNDANCPNIITADGTYQYCKSPETDQDSRKGLWNSFKKATLCKIHIWSIPNGQPLSAHYHYGDGYHA